MSDYTPETLRALPCGWIGAFEKWLTEKCNAHANAWKAQLAASQDQAQVAHEALANELCDCGMRDDHRRSLHAPSCMWAQWLDRAAPEPPEWVSHILKEGSREHVVLWDPNGAHCGEPMCEMNRPSEPPGEEGQG